MKEWIVPYKIKKWPDTILNYQGSAGITPFESYRMGQMKTFSDDAAATTTMPTATTEVDFL